MKGFDKNNELAHWQLSVIITEESYDVRKELEKKLPPDFKKVRERFYDRYVKWLSLYRADAKFSIVKLKEMFPEEMRSFEIPKKDQAKKAIVFLKQRVFEYLVGDDHVLLDPIMVAYIKYLNNTDSTIGLESHIRDPFFTRFFDGHLVRASQLRFFAGFEIERARYVMSRMLREFDYASKFTCTEEELMEYQKNNMLNNYEAQLLYLTDYHAIYDKPAHVSVDGKKFMLPVNGFICFDFVSDSSFNPIHYVPRKDAHIIQLELPNVQLSINSPKTYNLEELVSDARQVRPNYRSDNWGITERIPETDCVLNYDFLHSAGLWVGILWKSQKPVAYLVWLPAYIQGLNEDIQLRARRQLKRINELLS